MKRRILSFLCAVAILMGMVTVPAFAAVDPAAINGAQEYDTLQAAVDAYRSGVITLEQDASAITVAKDVYLDLNGYTVAGVTVTGGTLFVRDAKTDDYTVADGVYGKLTGVSGTVQAADGYLQIAQEGELSFHRVDLKLNGMALRPGNAGVYYTSLFAGDEMVAQQVETFGVALSVSAEPTGKNMDTLCAYSAFTGFVGGKTGNQTANGTLLTGIMKPTNSDGKNTWYAGMNVYGRAYVKTADGYIFGDCVARNLIQQVEAIDTVWASLSAVQKGSLLAMYETYESVMTLWNVPNMKNAFENPGSEEPDGDTVIVLPIPVKISDGKVVEDATITKDGYSVTVPAGVQLATDETELTLVITVKDSSDSGVTLEENQVLLPLDVHVEGVSETNTVPLTIHLGKQLPENLNLGNYGAYHVENGSANEMALIPMDALFTAHNQYKYTLDGEIILHIATFSEIALTADTEAKWEGEVDHSWYTKNPKATEFEIRNADQLWSFSQIVGGMAENIAQDSFKGKTVKLLSDIDLDDGENANDSNRIFYPIGYYNSEYTYTKTQNAITSSFKSFEGTFDGNGNTISNIYQNTWEMKGDHNWYDATLQYYRDGMGLFGKVYGGTVKNLTVRNFKSDGEITTTGVIAAYADCGAVFENIAIFDCNPRVYNIGNGGIVGCVGWYAKEAVNTPVTFTNITVDQTNKISALWGTYDAACGGLVGQYYPTSGQTGSPKNGGIKFVNCHVAAEMDVNNDVCGNYQYYWYRYCGIFIGSIKGNTSDENGYATANTADISAEGCTYKIGQWNNYYYCELVANSQASYTHDHQMSRLTVIDSLDEIKSGETWTQAGNFLLIDGDNKTCYHIVKNENEELVQHKHEDSGYDVGIDENKDGKDDLKEDKQIIYLPFNQLMTGDGWGVKAHLEFDGIVLNKDELEISEEKFVPNVSAGYNILSDVGSVAISDLFSEKENVKISYPTVHVYISPVGDDSTVKPACVYVTDGKFDNIANLPISGTGAAKITITDYYFCIPTTISVTITERQAVEKFTANTVGDQNAYTQITLGELFNVLEGVTLVDDVTATVTDPDGKATTVTTTATEWASKTIDLTKDGEWTAIINDDDAYCTPTTVTFTVNKADKFTKKFDKDFLYRVGNLNAFDLGYIFGEKETALSLSAVNVTVTEVAGNATGKYTSDTDWTKGDIRFTGTGVVTVTIAADYAKPLSLNLEVVGATNATEATLRSVSDGNQVLLRDVSFSSTYLYYKNATVYGNGFTLDITGADHSDLKDLSNKDSNKSAYCNIWMTNSNFDNIKIVGSVYPEVGMTADSDYGNAAIRTEGTCLITNSYISNCRVPLRVQGNTTLKNTTVSGGRYANIEVRSGALVLDNVKTINTVQRGSDGKTDVIGFGIVIHDEAAETSTISIVGDGLKQYNWVGKNEHKSVLSSDFNLSSAYKLIFDAGNDSRIYFENNGDKYVNTGILCLNSTISANAISGLGDRYVQEVNGYDAWVLTYTSTNAAHTAWFKESVTTSTIEFEPKQASVTPNYTGINAQTVEFTKGETYQFDTNIFSAEKFGEKLAVSSVELNGTSYNFGNTIPLTEGGVYEIVFTVVDPYNYSADLATTTVNHKVTISVTAIAKDAQVLPPVITFKDQNSKTYESKTVKGENKTYVMPNVSASDNATESNMNTVGIGSVVRDGVTVYFPIVDGYTTRSGSNYTRYYPLFTGISVTNFAEVGDTTGTTYHGTGNYTSVVGTADKMFIIPTGQATNCGNYVGKSGFSGDPSGNSSSGGWKDSGYSSTYGGTYLKSGTTNAAKDAAINGYERIVWIEYSYHAGNGDVYYYVIGYHCNQEDPQCVTADTMVNLADGTMKRIDEVTYEDQLVVWNFFTGNYDVVPSAIIFYHGDDNYRVLNLKFSDGTEVKVIHNHGFFDEHENAFVYIDETNVENYLGHRFAKMEEDGAGFVELVGYEVYEEYTGCYSIQSAIHINFMVEGMFSNTIPPIAGWFDYFEIGEGMKYDEEKMQADIEKYGLYTYEDFAEYVTYEQFIAFNGPYLKVLVGRGVLTYEDILELIATYVN